MKEMRRRITILIVFGALATGFYFLWKRTGNLFVELFAMVFATLSCEGAVVGLLGLLRPRTHRGIQLCHPLV